MYRVTITVHDEDDDNKRLARDEYEIDDESLLYPPDEHAWQELAWWIRDCSASLPLLEAGTRFVVVRCELERMEIEHTPGERYCYVAETWTAQHTHLLPGAE